MDRKEENNPDTFDFLKRLGFSLEQVINLSWLKAHVSENLEYREGEEEYRRLNFIRWLIEHNKLSR